MFSYLIYLLLCLITIVVCTTPDGYAEQDIHFPTKDPRWSKSIICDNKLVISNPATDTVSTLIYTEPFWDNLKFLGSDLWGIGSILECDDIQKKLLVGTYNTMENDIGELGRYIWDEVQNNWILHDELDHPSSPIGTGWGRHVWSSNGVTIVASPLADVNDEIGAGKIEVYKDNFWIQSLTNPFGIVAFQNWGRYAKGSISQSYFALLDSGNITMYTINSDGSLSYNQMIYPQFSTDYDIKWAKNIALGSNYLVVTDGSANDLSGKLYTYINSGGTWSFSPSANLTLVACDRCLFGSGDIKIGGNRMFIGSPNVGGGIGEIKSFDWNPGDNSWGIIDSFSGSESVNATNVGTFVDIVKDSSGNDIVIGGGEGVLSFQKTSMDTTNPPTLPPIAPVSPTPPPIPTKTPTESPTKTPTESPTKTPTESPTDSPTDSPTESPTDSPTESPTYEPSTTPTTATPTTATPVPTTATPTTPTTATPVPAIESTDDTVFAVVGVLAGTGSLLLIYYYGIPLLKASFSTKTIL